MLMKRLLKFFSTVHVAVYRLTGGKLGGSMRAGRILLITTTGRKTGKQRTVPLGYFEENGSYLIVASNGGQDYHPGWYHNLTDNPRVSVQIRDEKMSARAEVVSAEQRATLWPQVVAKAPGYGAYQTRTSREIPLVLLHPEG